LEFEVPGHDKEVFKHFGANPTSCAASYSMICEAKVTPSVNVTRVKKPTFKLPWELLDGLMYSSLYVSKIYAVGRGWQWAVGTGYSEDSGEVLLRRKFVGTRSSF
jgi:hypothetical protein